VLRSPVITSALIGASKVSQLQENVAAVKNIAFTSAELTQIDRIVAS
jgi:L-glyceraldehyde 3-phosphate reductase